MSALYAWLRRHPRLVDAVIAAPIALIGVAGSLVTHRYLLALFALALTAPIVVRRAHPAGAFVTAIVVGAAQVAGGIAPVFSDLAIVILLYTLAAYSTRRNSLLGLITCLLGCVIEVVGQQARANGLNQVDWVLVGSVMFAGPSLIAWVLGDSTRYRRAYYANLEERAARLERDRDTHAKIAAAAERARIARELHDVVAHNVSVMVVQADGAAYAMDADPARARDALTAISATGRQALSEMRALLGVLRRGDDSGPDETGGLGTGGLGTGGLAPQPDLGQLDELLEQTRAAGLPVSYAVQGQPQPLAAGTALTAYRIIQESLTNTRKHAGSMASASVVLRYTDTEVELAIADNGLGAAAACDGAGHGLTGMTERAAMYGGSVQAGPSPDGGFRITARLPITPAPVTPVTAVTPVTSVPASAA